MPYTPSRVHLAAGHWFALAVQPAERWSTDAAAWLAGRVMGRDELSAALSATMLRRDGTLAEWGVPGQTHRPLVNALLHRQTSGGVHESEVTGLRVAPHDVPDGSREAGGAGHRDADLPARVFRQPGVRLL